MLGASEISLWIPERTNVQKRTIKETYKRDEQKRPTDSLDTVVVHQCWASLRFNFVFPRGKTSKEDLLKRTTEEADKRKPLTMKTISSCTSVGCLWNCIVDSREDKRRKVTYKRDIQKRHTKETNKRDLHKRPTQETNKKRPTQENYNRDRQKRHQKTDLLKRPTKQMY